MTSIARLSVASCVSASCAETPNRSGTATPAATRLTTSGLATGIVTSCVCAWNPGALTNTCHCPAVTPTTEYVATVPYSGAAASGVRSPVAGTATTCAPTTALPLKSTLTSSTPWPNASTASNRLPRPSRIVFQPCAVTGSPGLTWVRAGFVSAIASISLVDSGRGHGLGGPEGRSDDHGAERLVRAGVAQAPGRRPPPPLRPLPPDPHPPPPRPPPE